MDKKTESKPNKQEDEKLSVCDIMKEDTSEIIKKIESQIPALFQNYSDIYTQYLHSLDDIFGTCYIAEKEFFDKLNIDQGILQQIKEYHDVMKANYIENMDIASKLFDEYIRIKISTIQSFDNYVHLMMEYYSKMLSQVSKATK